jgi:molybdopterin-guanine dinucleotide biosynthesis protein A
VVVVSRPGILMPALDVPVLMDRRGPDAPPTGLVTGLTALGSGDVLALACDLPATGPALDLLIAAPLGLPVAAVARRGRVQPLCARSLRACALVAAECLLVRGEAAMRAFLEELAPPVDVSAASLLSVNTHADLTRAAG